MIRCFAGGKQCVHVAQLSGASGEALVTNRTFTAKDRLKTLIKLLGVFAASNLPRQKNKIVDITFRATMFLIVSV
jgi:hypothetical protein